MKQRLYASLLCGALLAFGPQAAKAQGLLFLNDLGIGLGAEVIILDGAPIGTATPLGLTTASDGLADGLISYAGGVGGGVFTVNVTTGISKPIIGPNKIDLNSVNVSTTGGGVLDVGFSDIGFTFAGSPGVKNAIGGTTVGTVTAQYFVDPANGYFTGQSGAQGPFGPGAFSGTASFNAVGLGTPFSISEIATITHTGVGATSFNMETSVVPEPTSLVLLGAGFLGSALLRRKRKTH
jgi:PEP-CTERM motif-containing protein